jgi:hypothetical protein
VTDPQVKGVDLYGPPERPPRTAPVPLVPAEGVSPFQR